MSEGNYIPTHITSFSEWWDRKTKNWEFDNSADEQGYMIACEQAFAGGRKVGVNDLTKVQLENQTLQTQLKESQRREKVLREAVDIVECKCDFRQSDGHGILLRVECSACQWLERVRGTNPKKLNHKQEKYNYGND